jgi:nicotinamidase-related amidase
VVDVVNDHVSPEGVQSAYGIKVAMTEEERETLLSNNRRLIDAMRAAGRPVAYVHTEKRVDELDCAHAEIGRRKQPLPERVTSGAIGSWGAQICDAIAPEAGDIVITKKGHSAFGFTELDQMLRRLGVDTLIATGGGTPGCLSDSVRQASHHGYDLLVVADAAYRPPNNPLVWAMESKGRIVTTAEVLDLLDSGAS